MDKRLNEQLISIIRNQTPKGVNTADLLADILNLGKESVYRRLRGEINFTFYEIVLLSSALGFSIDNMINTNTQKNVVYELDMLSDPSDYFKIHGKRVADFTELYKSMNKKQGSILKLAANTLPAMFSFKYELLSKFSLYKWVYQQKPLLYPLQEFIKPDYVRELEEECLYHADRLQNVQIIFDNNVFNSLIHDILYFYQLHLLTIEEYDTLKKELLCIINEVENLAINGCNSQGSDVMMYLSSIYLDTSYGYCQYGDKQICSIRIYSLTAFSSDDPRICNVQKRWIDSLKKYSILISQSGEKHRLEYFNNQRKLLNDLL